MMSRSETTEAGRRARDVQGPTSIEVRHPRRENRTSKRPRGFDGLASTRIGFGCAGLMQSSSQRHRQRLLGEAFEQGIRHFDVARMYGLGVAEREVGRFAQVRRDDISIATKFGIEPAGGIGRLANIQAPARAALARIPPLRAAVKRRSQAFHQPRRYDLATLSASLATSLRELGTDYVDLLLIHGPEQGDVLDLAELGDCLEELRRAGRILAWGFAGNPEPCIRLSRQTTAATILQIRDDILGGAVSRVALNQRVITFGAISGALNQVLRHVTRGAETRARWTDIVQQDCSCPDVVASLLLQDALNRNEKGIVLFSTAHPERIAVATQAGEALTCDPDHARLRAFNDLVRAELAAPYQQAG
jgi:D-threo-aldose 1-dehydrogenase